MKPHALETVYFDFENDFVDTFRCIPMIVRYKLDTCLIKLKLPEWVKLTVEEKRELATRPCFTETEIARYRRFLIQLVAERCGKTVSELPPVDASWDALEEVPDEVQHKAAEFNFVPLTIRQWIQFDVLQRFALVKLSRSGHEGKNFPRALNEFGIQTGRNYTSIRS
ncbi:nitrate reductase associated protein [Larkinella terrae]|uniref:Nitrate reductase maturation protein NarM n=1 Tax=Larkinella terrae TaxID=2025311 RepID=A0A7K0ENK4_9BACT|nr:nitrate reductase associated protein [Larkinella terrae]MRS63131.1 nitrate reductase maturation protein NarM [Larkinella terrae]